MEYKCNRVDKYIICTKGKNARIACVFFQDQIYLNFGAIINTCSLTKEDIISSAEKVGDFFQVPNFVAKKAKEISIGEFLLKEASYTIVKEEEEIFMVYKSTEDLTGQPTDKIMKIAIVDNTGTIIKKYGSKPEGYYQNTIYSLF